MRFYDETGLLGIVCRHGIPFRYLNMRTGERSANALFLIRHITTLARSTVYADNQQVPFTDLRLMYDIGCRFQAYVLKEDARLHSIMRTCVNAFHIKAHELKCQIKYGPRRQKGLGESDGEGNERDWDSKRHLVVSGRSANSLERMQMLSAQSYHYAHRNRVQLGRLLNGRYHRASKNLQIFSNRLHELQQKAAGQNFQDGGVKIDLINNERQLQNCADEQVSYLENVRVAKMREAEYANIYQKIVEEEELEVEIEASGGNRNNGLRTHLRQCRSELNALLQRSRFKRQDWAPESELRIKYQRKIADLSIFKAIKQRAEVSSDAPPAVLTRFTNQQENLLSMHNYTYKDWDPANPKSHYARFAMQELVFSLETILKSLLGAVFSHSVNLRILRTKISGQKEAGTVQESISKNTANIAAFIKEFNALAKTLPPKHRVQLPSNFAAIQTGVASSPNLSSATEQTLWKFQILRDRVLDEPPSVGLNWSISQILLEAVDCYIRKCRAEEEIRLIQLEVGRLIQWLKTRSRAIESLLTDPLSRTRLFQDLCWSDACTIFHIRNADLLPQLLDPADSQKLNGRL
ncbi:hypothetical protein TWF281_006786 [Arthrobotrys megalospora]